MASSNPAHLEQDFALIQACSRSRKQLGANKRSLSLNSISYGSTDSLVDDMIKIFGIFANIMRKLVIEGAENQHLQLVSPNSARKL